MSTTPTVILSRQLGRVVVALGVRAHSRSPTTSPRSPTSGNFRTPCTRR